MSIRSFIITRNALPQDDHQSSLGESPLPFAPHITMGNNQSIVPQQYLDVIRTVDNIENILNKIDFHEHYLLFAGELNNILYIQVGIIGTENYPNNKEQSKEVKIVYGRRWMIEPTTPTSEVVQTALLAIKKAREHELREKFVLTICDQIDHHKTKKTTPFNSHMDLPLMVGNSKELTKPSSNDIYELTNQINFSSFNVQLNQITPLKNESYLVEATLANGAMPEQHFIELLNKQVSFIIKDQTQQHFLHGLMTELIHCSDCYIEENFLYDGFARFSQDVNPLKIAEFSYKTRNIDNPDKRFESYFTDMSYRVDSSKAPNYANGELGRKQRSAVIDKRVNAGHMPNELMVENTKNNNKG